MPRAPRPEKDASLHSLKGPGYVEMDLVYVRGVGPEEKYFVAAEAFTRLCFIRQLPNRKATSLVPVVEEMIRAMKPKLIRADMEFSAFDVLNLLDRHKISVDLVPFEVKDYTRLATVNRLCRSIRHYRKSGIRPGELEHYHNRVKPDHYYPNKCSADVTYEENVAIMNQKHAQGILPQRGGPVGNLVHVRLLKGTFEKERPRWSRAKFKVMGVFQGRYALCRQGDPSGNIILRRFNEVHPGDKSHQYADDSTEPSNLWLVRAVEECTDRKGNKIATLAEANKLDCWYRLRMHDGSQLWATVNKLRFQSNDPTPAERRFFGEKAPDRLTVLHMTKEEIAASRRKFPVNKK